MQASVNVTIECEYKVVCDLSNGVISNDLELVEPKFQGHDTFQRRIYQKPCILDAKSYFMMILDNHMQVIEWYQFR